ncbi:MAG: MFS transporter [Jatrophihabitans sp.]|nr:MAG: MFS transporter [Jatrophihabitans sp.]
MTFRGVLGVREFRWLWLAGVQSLLGDQLARVAVSVIVFDATSSGFLTSTVYALTYLPALVGPPLGVLADRLPRRAVLVAGDLLRALILAAMAVPALPWPWLVPLITAAVMIGAPWKAAESALVADILSGEGYVIGAGLRLATSQGAQLVGFATGGIAVAILGARSGLLIDAATFAVSALVIRLGLDARPAPWQASALAGERPSRSLWAGVTVVWRTAPLRWLTRYTWLAGAYVVPDGLAAPIAARLHGGASAVGYLLASVPLGMLVGCVVLVRYVPVDRRRRLMPTLAAGAGVPLMACIGAPPLAVMCALWALAGAAMAYQVQAMTDFVRLCPPQLRGQAIAFAASGLLAVQGVGLVLGGAVAQAWSPFGAVALAGLTGSVMALTWSRGRQEINLLPTP